MGPRLGRSERVVRDPVDESHGQGSLGVERVRVQHQAGQRRGGDPAGQKRRDESRHEPEAHLRELETGLGRGDDQVAGGGKTGASAVRGALHRGQVRRGQRSRAV